MCWKFFGGSDVLRKYFNMKILQHRSREECTERVTAMEKFFTTNCIRGYHVYKKVWTATVGEAFVYKREPKNSSDQYAVAVKNEGTYHKTFTSKAVTGVLAVFATGKYTVTSVSVEREHVEW